MKMLVVSSCIVVLLLVISPATIDTQRVAPGVPPQAYQQPPPPQQQQQQYQQQQQFQQQHGQQPVQQQQFGQVPVQHQQHGQVPVQHQQHGQVPVQQQQQQQPAAAHGHGAQSHGHGHGGQRPGQLLDASNVGQERDHIQEHMSVPIDTSQMSEQELQFHYFKMHDADGNNKLDGCELVKSLVHWHDQANHDPKSGQPIPEAKIFKDDELINMIDPILANDDKNSDGYIDYGEFVQAQASVASRGGNPPPPQH